MTLPRGLPTAVPCGVCLIRITGWDEPRDDEFAAQPCGHTEQEILAIGRTMTRIPYASHLTESARSAPCPATDPVPGH